MTRINYAHICEKAFLSQNGNLNLIGIFEKISATQFPATFPSLSLVSSIKANKGKHQKTILILNQKGEQIMNPISINLQVQEDNSNLRLIGDINNLQIPSAGIYTVEIHFNGSKLHQLQFTVEQSKKPIPQNR